MLEHRAIGFGAVAGLGAQGLAGLLHRQIGGQLVDIAQIQVGGHPARQQQDFTGDLGGDIRVAVAVAAHPGREANRRRLQWQMQAGGGVQGLVGLAQVVGDRLPEGMLDHREAPLGFIHRRRPGPADFLGVPGLGDQPLQALADLFALGSGQVTVVLQRQLRGNGIVFLDQRAPGHLGGMRGEHQFDVQAPQLSRQGLGAMAFGTQAGEQLRQHPRFERRRLRLVTPVDQLILLGDIRQVEELVERPGHRQQFVVTEVTEAGAQLGTGRIAAIGLGALANPLDLVEKLIAVLVSDGIAQQFTQQVNVLTQTHINIGHRQALRRTLRRFQSPRVHHSDEALQAGRSIARRQKIPR